ncbi:MAG: hypothetical protein K2K45_01650 [Muribaculaceae bacterium]|nr:hypothetical protein [Muribaculaceae bacterium]
MNKYVNYLVISALCVMTLTLTSCFSSKLTIPKEQTLLLNVDRDVRTDKFQNLEKPIRVVTTSDVNEDDVVDMDMLNKAIRFLMPAKYSFTPSIDVFAKDAAEFYLQSMDFEVRQKADYCLNVSVRKLQIIFLDKKGQEVEYKIQLSLHLTDEAGQTIVQMGSVTGSYTQHGNTGINPTPIGSAFNNAMKKLNWSNVADVLRMAKTAKQEKNAQVKGDGDTALEHTVIRWYILSTPQGADVSWRVVSSTPDVANTNSNFVGTTPYESTESFDIKGLTYNNSGNVQIEVTCEKAGYLSQRKRFNLRQAIDQKEISAKFNLVKDE